MAHRTFIVEETSQPKTVLTHDVVQATITAVDSINKTINVTLDAPYKPRSLTTDFGRVQDSGYDGLPASPVITELEDVEIVYNCEREVENPAGAFLIGEKCLILMIGTDPYAVGFPNEVKTCVTNIYLRPTIDGKALAYGGQSFSISYKKVDETVFTDTDQKPVYGTWDTPDPKRHGIAGPFLLEDWDRFTDVRINLHRARDVSAWRGNTPANKDNFQSAVVTAPVDGFDPPWGSGKDGETDVWDGLHTMFNYWIEDTGGAYFDYLMNNLASPNDPVKGETIPAATSCTGSLCPRTGVVPAQAWIRATILGFANTIPTPSFVGEQNQVSTERYRVAERIYIELTAETVINNLVPEEVFNRDTSQEESGLVLERNFGYGLKQRELKFQTWVYKTNLHSPATGLATGYGRFNEIRWRRISVTSINNTLQPAFAMISFQAKGAPGWSIDVLSPSGCLSSWHTRWYGAVATRDLFFNYQYTLTDFTGFPTLGQLPLQKAMITIDDEGSPLTASWSPTGPYTIVQPRHTPGLIPSHPCVVNAPLSFNFAAQMVSADDRWY